MTQSIGIVGAKEVNQNGKQKINIDGQWYYAGRCDVSSLSVGQRVDFMWSTFGDGGKLRGIESWGLTPDQPSAEEAAAAQQASVKKPWGGKPGGGGFGRGQDRGLEIDLQCMRFIGQTVGSAIDNQRISEPKEIAAWVKGAYEAIQFAKSWGATAPAPAQQTATPAGKPSQTPQGSSAGYAKLDANGNRLPVRPTGNFGYGQKHRDTPWNVMGASNLQWFLEQGNTPADVKQKARDELFFREQDAQRAAALDPKDPPSPTDDFDDDIPF